MGLDVDLESWFFEQGVDSTQILSSNMLNLLDQHLSPFH